MILKTSHCRPASHSSHCCWRFWSWITIYFWLSHSILNHCPPLPWRVTSFLYISIPSPMGTDLSPKTVRAEKESCLSPSCQEKGGDHPGNWALCPFPPGSWITELRTGLRKKNLSLIIVIQLASLVKAGSVKFYERYWVLLEVTQVGDCSSKIIQVANTI